MSGQIYELLQLPLLPPPPPPLLLLGAPLPPSDIHYPLLMPLSSRNCERFGRLYAHVPRVRVPRIK